MPQHMPRDLVGLLIDNLQANPEQWEWSFINGKLYSATNPILKTTVWLANQMYGLHVDAPGVRFGDSVVIFGWIRSWRRRIYRAFIAAAPPSKPDDTIGQLRAKWKETIA